MTRDVFSIGEQIYTEIINKEPQPYDSYVSAYDFYDVLYQLFKKLNLLNETEDKDYDKIRLLDEFPDKRYLEEGCVIFSLGNRDYQKFKSETGKKERTQLKPAMLESGYDLVSNNIKTDYANRFDNEIKLTIFSTSLRRVHQLSRFVESVLLKHKGFLARYVEKIVLKGQSVNKQYDEYFEKRLFSRSINLQVITTETYSLVSEELKYIK